MQARAGSSDCKEEEQNYRPASKADEMCPTVEMTMCPQMQTVNDMAKQRLKRYAAQRKHASYDNSDQENENTCPEKKLSLM